jgi:two-component system sensor histidine kinase GlrK
VIEFGCAAFQAVGRRVTLFRTRSILQLILIGFVVVTVPLIVALITSAFYVDRLAKYGQRSVLEAMAATQSSRMLIEHAVAMERSARQFQVLNDQALLDVYRDRHAQFQLVAHDMLEQLSLAPNQRDAIVDMVSREQMVYARLTDANPTPGAIAAALDAFPVISASGRAILADSSQRIAESVNEMQGLANRAQNLLLWETMALIPAAIGLVLLFATLVIKPLGQLHRAIRRLGDGQFSEEITVSGPDDLRQLGGRLEWMRRRILTLESQKAMFLRHISHELKTPLTSIREGSELLNEQLIGRLNADQAEIAGMLRHNSLRLQKLIEDLLSFSMLTRDILRLRPERLALDELIREVAAAHTVAARAKSVELELALEPVMLDGDRDKLRTVIDNLFSNAIKYSPVNGRVSVALATLGDAAIIGVRDQGPGVARDERERIFDAFYQGRARSSGPIKGSGLGLSIAREFVHLHRGTIEAMAASGGAHFRVTLPGVIPAAAARAFPVQADAV